MTVTRTPAARYAILSIALISCSMLIYEILLTRICALRLYFHFGYLVVSNCLLAVGASGTMISIFQDSWRPRARRWIFAFAVLYLVSLVVTYAILLNFPIPADLSLRDPSALGRFSLFTLLSAVPFFFGGTVIGLILAFNSGDINRVYSIDLLAAGLGCFLTPFLLARFGAGGCMVFLGLLALATVVVAGPERLQRPLRVAGVLLGAVGLWLLPSLDQRFPVPGKLRLDLTSEKILELGQFTEYSRWSSNSRIDLFPVEEPARFMFARGARQGADPIPEQKLIMQDGWAGTFIMDFSGSPETLPLVRRSMYSATLQLKDRPSVLVIGMGGGLDVWAATLSDARRIKAVELNRQVIDIHRNVLGDYSRDLLENPGVEIVHGEGRSELMRDDERYDVIQMTGIDTWTALASGAYVLAENYLYTQEAIASMYAHLAPDGILQIIRFAAPMETLRLLANIDAALAGFESPPLDRSVVVMRTPDGLAATLLKRGVFSAQELAQLERFAADSGIVLTYIASRTGKRIVEQFIRSPRKAEMIKRFRRDISPTTDDRPYFFNFHRWRNPFESVSFLPEPANVSQGNPAFLLGQLAVSIVLSLGLILLPLVLFRRRGIERTHVGTFLVYFVGLGIGFIAIEISLMQKLTLFLGHPLYSITVTLFAILVFTGFGSMLSEPIFRPDRILTWPVPLALVVLVGAVSLASPWLVRELIGLPLAARVGISVALLAPIGLVLGVPFAYGIRLADRLNPSIIPWAWAVNACCTVIGSLLTVVLSMNFGFSFVLMAAVAVYAVSFASLRRLPISTA